MPFDDLILLNFRGLSIQVIPFESVNRELEGNLMHIVTVLLFFICPGNI
jgi:hypothetical protein